MTEIEQNYMFKIPWRTVYSSWNIDKNNKNQC